MAVVATIAAIELSIPVLPTGKEVTRYVENYDTTPDARVDLRDVQIAARHADPRITMRYDRAPQEPDRHPNCILAAYMASGT